MPHRFQISVYVYVHTLCALHIRHNPKLWRYWARKIYISDSTVWKIILTRRTNMAHIFMIKIFSKTAPCWCVTSNTAGHNFRNTETTEAWLSNTAFTLCKRQTLLSYCLLSMKFLSLGLGFLYLPFNLWNINKWRKNIMWRYKIQSLISLHNYHRSLQPPACMAVGTEQLW